MLQRNDLKSHLLDDLGNLVHVRCIRAVLIHQHHFSPTREKGVDGCYTTKHKTFVDELICVTRKPWHESADIYFLVDAAEVMAIVLRHVLLMALKEVVYKVTDLGVVGEGFV